MDCIDILLATYNGEKYLNEQIESILNQTHTAFRLIISDDYSTDRTRDLLIEFKNRDKRIELHFQEKNLGYIKNFEFLLKQVRNDYYMLSDQDDVWIAEKAKLSLEALKREEAILVFSDLLVVNQNLEVLETSFWKTICVDRKVRKFNDYRMLYLYNCVTGCTILSKSKYIDKFLPFPTNSWIAHDYWMALILSQYGTLYAIKTPLVHYRQHGDNQIGAFSLKNNSTESFLTKRAAYIKFKIEQFSVYVEYNKMFSEKLQQKNIIALSYFEDVYKKKNYNLEGYGIFHFIFKNESPLFYLRNFVYLNFPFAMKLLNKIK